MKKIFFLLLLLPAAVLAQSGKKDILHTVAAKESLSSIGRLYNINGRELANYNNIDYNAGLALGQVLKIPSNGTATVPVTSSQTIKPVKEVLPVKAVSTSNSKNNNPIYHTVEKKQTLYAISKMYNVTIADIKKWNNLGGDALSEGVPLIVGYGAEKESTVAVVTEQVKNTKDAAPASVKEEVQETKPQLKKEEVAVVKTPVENKPTVVPVQEKKEAPVVNVNTASDYKGGVFKNDYESQTAAKNIASENGTGGIFKSSSGWSDGKYYCLHNSALPGTIIKITNNANGKSVYAKVLDVIPDIKQNDGLIIRLSNAAADILGSTDTKMNCTLNYSK